MWNIKIIKPRCLFVVLLTVLGGLSGIGLSREGKSEPVSVVHCPNPKASLEARWQWTMEQIAKQPAPVWIGYSTERLMSERSFVGRWPVDPDYPTLSELIYDVRMELPERSDSGYGTADKVVKEVACLFEIDQAAKSIGQIQTSNISLTVYMNRGVLFWLGKVGTEQSFSLLRKLYDETDDEYVKIRLMGRITDLYHPRIVSFLGDVIQNEKSERVRKEAVEELDEYHSQESLDILLRTVRNDPSVAVREEAIDSIGHIETTAAEEALIEIAKTGSPPSVRREAIDKLRDTASPKVMDCLVSIIDKQDEVFKIQQEALDALADIENDRAMDELIRIAGNHVKPRIREEAIDHLSDMDELEPGNALKVVKCFQSIIDNQEEKEEIRCNALDALKDIEHKDVRTYITKTARNHPNQEIRRQAQEIVAEWIRDT
ncbi:MAG: HEAT repeat domain-containing protein [Sedimentisphaerales bacterium]|nr:HEAT repeat domain-containing protein [Sedimentisphaerales bacterium]